GAVDDDYLVVIKSPDGIADRFGWRTLLAASGYAHLLVLAVVSLAVARGLGPVRVLLLGVVVVALALLRKPGWTGIALMLVAAFSVTADALYLGSMTGVFHPTSVAQFLSSAGGLTAFAVTVAAAVGCLRTPDGGAGPNRSALLTAGTGVTVGVAIFAMAIGGSIAYNEPSAGPHDVRLRALWYDCTPRTMKAVPGQVAIYVKNEDGSRRAFEIADLGVVLNVPAHRAARTEFTAAAGHYTYVCHVPGRGKRIRGELVVG
ncbi:MAG: cupredoxin domain-containing protein, partial [Actinomycetota bacterium]